MIKANQKRLDEDRFLAMRKEVLSLWPTGREVDLAEAVAYQKSLPDSKNFGKVVRRLAEEDRMVVFPRAGTPVVEEEIELVRTLVETGVPLIPVTTDTYTRFLQFDKAQQGLEESIRSGRAKLNGYPIVNHGVKTTRRVVEAVDGAFNPRTSRLANSLVGEIAFASGMTGMPSSFFPWFGSYEKKATIEECISTAQYVFRLMGYYADRGVSLTADVHGWLPNGVFPPGVNIATQITEALVAAGQGVKNVIPLVECHGHLAQDLASLRVAPRLLREYLDRLGYRDVAVPGTFAAQVPLYAFPQDMGGAFAYVTYSCMVAALGKAQAASLRTVDEGVGVPTRDSHAATYRAANWILDVVRTQKFAFASADVDLEDRITEAEVRALLDNVLTLGDGDVVVGTIRATEAGMLDSPFPLNVNAAGRVLGVRDVQGACRYVEFGDLPLPAQIKEFHRRKVAEREEREGRKMDYYVAIDDFWAFSKGRILGRPGQS